MAEKVRQPPGASEQSNFRALEAFYLSVERMLKLVGSTTTTVGSISGGGVVTVTITVDGARPDVGMTVQPGVPSGLDTGIVPWGKVTAHDTVVLVLYNRTGSPIVLPEYTYYVRVMP